MSLPNSKNETYEKLIRKQRLESRADHDRGKTSQVGCHPIH